MMKKIGPWLLIPALLALLSSPASASQRRVERLEEGHWRIVETTRYSSARIEAERRTRETASNLCSLLGYSYMEIDPASVSYRRARSPWSRPSMRRPSRLSLEVQFRRDASDSAVECAPASEAMLRRDVERIARQLVEGPQ